LFDGPLREVGCKGGERRVKSRRDTGREKVQASVGVNQTVDKLVSGIGEGLRDVAVGKGVVDVENWSRELSISCGRVSVRLLPLHLCHVGMQDDGVGHADFEHMSVLSCFGVWVDFHLLFRLLAKQRFYKSEETDGLHESSMCSIIPTIKGFKIGFF